MHPNPNEVLTIPFGKATISITTGALVELLMPKAVLSPTQPSAPGKIGNLNASGEFFVGIMRGENGAADYRLYILPGDVEDKTFDQAAAWAKSIGGDLPTRREQRLLYANAKDQFLEKDYYWSSEQDAATSDYAWIQDFSVGSQTDSLKSNEYRARAVRRELIIQ